MKKILSLFLFVIAFDIQAQQPIVWMTTPAPPLSLPTFNPLSIQSNSITDTRIDVRWDDIGADSYDVTRNGAPVSGSPFSGSTTSFSNTGLTVNTSYAYVVTANKSGYLPTTANETTSTLTYSPVFLGLFHGAVAAPNSVGTTYSNQIGITKGTNKWFRLNSLTGSNYIDFPDAGTHNLPALNVVQGTPDFQELMSGTEFILGKPGNNWDAAYPFNSQISLIGDFTIMWSERSPMGVGETLVSNNAGSYSVSYNYLGAIIRINGTNYTALWPQGSHQTGRHLNIFGVKRSGSNVYAWDGTTWSGATAAASNTFVIDSFVPPISHPGYEHGFCIVNSALSDSQVNEFFDIWKRANYSAAIDDPAPIVKGISFPTTLTTGGTGNYLPFAWLGNAGGGGYKTVNCISQGTYSFFTSQAKADVTYKMGNKLFIRDHVLNKLTAPVDLGDSPNAYYTYDYDNTTTIYDQIGHTTTSLLNYDNRLQIYSYFPHYDQTAYVQLETVRSGPNFNFTGLKKWSPWKGQTNYVARYLAYPRVNRYGNKLVKVSADFNTIQIYHEPSMEISTDNSNSWDFNKIFNLYASNAELGTYIWAYPYLINNGGSNDKIVIILNFIILNAPNAYNGWAICWADSSNPYVFKNWDGSFSKDIRDKNFISWAELKANFVFTNAAHGYQSFIYGAAWSGGTTYNLNDLAATGTGSATKFWRSKENSNVGNSPAEDSHWTQANSFSQQVSTCYMDTNGEIFGMCNDMVSGPGYLRMFYGTPGGSMTFKPANNFSAYLNGLYHSQIVKEGAGYSYYVMNTGTPNQFTQWTTTTASKGTAWTNIGVITDGTHHHNSLIVNENHAWTGVVNLYGMYGVDAANPQGLWIK